MTTHVTVKPTATTFTIPCRTVTESNAKGHWRPKANRAKAQRRAALMHATAATAAVRPALPCVVLMTRIGKRKLDSDNLASSCKHLRDGIADFLGVDDRHEHIVRYEYAQEVGKEYAVRIEFAPMGADNQNGVGA